MSCILRVSGTGTSIESIELFMTRSSLGEVAASYRPRGAEGVTKSSWLNIEVSSMDLDDLDGQIRDAVAFLSQHQTEIHELCGLPGVKGAVLDFAVAWRKDVVSQFERFPPELVRLAGLVGLGLEISHYSVE